MTSQPVKQAIILAGGEGIKLRPLTFSTPKPLLPIINHPILEFVIVALKNAGITHIIITADYLSDQIIDYVQTHSFGISIQVQPITQYHGTAQILADLTPQLHDTFLVVWGDCLVDLPFANAIAYFQERNASCGLIARKEQDILGKGGFVIENNHLQKIIPINEKSDTPYTETEILSDAWIYYFKKEILNLIPKDRPMDIHLDLIQAVLDAGQQPDVLVIDQFWVVVGRIHPYIAANFWILQNIGQPDYIGPNTTISPTAKLIPPYFIDADCQIDDGVELGPNVIIGQGSHIHRGVQMDNCIIHHHTTISEYTFLKNNLISHHCQIGSHCHIGQLAIIAPHCQIGNDCILEDGARIGPNITLADHTCVKDFIFPNTPNREPVCPQSLPEKALTICQILQEAGEQSFSALQSHTQFSETELATILDQLTHQQVIACYGSNPVIYFLK